MDDFGFGRVEGLVQEAWRVSTSLPNRGFAHLADAGVHFPQQLTNPHSALSCFLHRPVLYAKSAAPARWCSRLPAAWHHRSVSPGPDDPVKPKDLLCIALQFLRLTANHLHIG